MVEKRRRKGDPCPAEMYRVLGETEPMHLGTSVVVQWLELSTSTAGGVGSVPGWGIVGPKNKQTSRQKPMQLKGKRAVHDLKQTGSRWGCVYCPPVQGTPTLRVRSLGQEDLLEGEMLLFLPGESRGQRSQAAAVLGVAEGKIRLSTRAHTYCTDLVLCLGVSDQSGQANDEQGTRGVACWEQSRGLASPSGRKKHACRWAGRSRAGRPLVGTAGKTRDGKWVVCGPEELSGTRVPYASARRGAQRETKW